MIIVGLTGGLGTGKSTVAGFFRQLGAYVIDWDQLARKVTCPHSQAWEEIVDHFGRGILNEDLTINRPKLAEIVFSDERELAQLNRIVHPRVSEEDARITGEIGSHDPDALVVKDIPLLFEAACPIFVDKVVVVSANEQIRLGRLEEKGIAREDARRRIRCQLPIEEKTECADFVVDNDRSPEQTMRQVEEIYSSLKGKRRRGRRRAQQKDSGRTSHS